MKYINQDKSERDELFNSNVQFWHTLLIGILIGICIGLYLGARLTIWSMIK
jgi:uncharacterized membrane-anchored protein YhcB (DUF1043 family)